MVKNHSDSHRRNLLLPLYGLFLMIRSGQVRLESLTCTFRASYCSARLSRAQVSAFTSSSVRDRKKMGGGNEGGGGTRSPTRVSVKVIWNLECPVGLNQKRICAQFGRSAKREERSYIMFWN